MASHAAADMKAGKSEGVGLCRACEFILLLLKRLNDDRSVSLSTAANEVYYQTLNKYHAWYTATAFVVALKVRFVLPQLPVCLASTSLACCLNSCMRIRQACHCLTRQLRSCSIVWTLCCVHASSCKHAMWETTVRYLRLAAQWVAETSGTWALSRVVHVQLVPSREGLFAALGTPGEEMMQQVVVLVGAFEPLLRRVQAFLAQHDLDFQTKV